MKFKTIIVSDIHLWTPDSKYQKVLNFLKKNSCENLILNWDIIDWRYIKIFWDLPKKHRIFLNYIIELSKKDETNIYYIKWNHDEFLKRILPIQIWKFQLLKDLVYKSINWKKYYICHWDQFDKIEWKLFILSLISFLWACFLYRLNRIYNNRRTKKWLKYYSIVKHIKRIAKAMMVWWNKKFYPRLEDTAKRKNCQWIICWHIHKAENLFLWNIHYLNSWDRLESLTAITEDYKWNRNIFKYKE